MKKEIEKAIRETLVVQNKESIKYTVDRILRLFDVGGSLPMWTEIHIQPLDIDDIENSKVYWIKHPQKKWSVYDKDLVTAMKGFMERWGNDL